MLIFNHIAYVQTSNTIHNFASIYQRMILIIFKTSKVYAEPLKYLEKQLQIILL